MKSIGVVYLCDMDVLWTISRQDDHSISSSESEMSSLLLLLDVRASTKGRRGMEGIDSLLFLSGGSRDLLSVVVVAYHTFLRRPLEKQKFSTV